MKQILFSALFFILAAFAGYFMYNEFRSLTRWVYVLSTNGAITFIGKDIDLWGTYWFQLYFGLWAAILFLYFSNMSLFRATLNISIAIFSFIVVVATISSTDAQLKLVECTMCDDGTRQLHFNSIPYLVFALLGFIISLAPRTVQVIRRIRISAISDQAQ